MASTATAESATDPRTTRYRELEQALWRHYRLSPRETFLELHRPRCRMRALEVGSGEPVLLVHGTVGPGGWASLVAGLPGFRSIVLDRPGWGLSSPIDFGAGDYGQIAGDLLRGTLDALGLQQAHVVGGSVGDVWALRLAQRHPSHVGRVVLLGGGPIVAEAGVPGVIKLIASPAGALMVRLMNSPARVRSMLRGSGHGSSLDAGSIPDVFLEWRAAVGRETDAMHLERAMVRAIVQGNTYRRGVTLDEAELAAIRAPTLMIYGTADGVGSVDVWRRVTGLMPHAELDVVEGAGHMPWFEDPTGVAERVARFLSN